MEGAPVTSFFCCELGKQKKRFLFVGGSGLAVGRGVVGLDGDQDGERRALFAEHEEIRKKCKKCEATDVSLSVFNRPLYVGLGEF